MNAVSQKIEDLIETGWNVSDFDQYYRWRARVIAFLRQGISEKAAADFDSITESNWQSSRSARIGMLEGVSAYRELGYLSP